MFKKIISTIGSKVLITALSFATVVLTTQVLGAEGRGEVSLFLLNIVIVMMFNDFVGGGALVYLIPRNEPLKILIPSYIWGCLCAVIVSFSLNVLDLVAEGNLIHLCCISLVMSLNSVNLMIILGKNNIGRYNVLNLIQNGLITIVLIVLFYYLQEKDFSSYVMALYISGIITFVFSFISLIKYLKYTSLLGSHKVIGQAFKLGSFVQIGNLVQLLNYRLSYYLLEKFTGTASVGIYSTGSSVAEGMWVISKGLALVQYASISNSTDDKYSKNLTVLLLRASLVTVLALLFPMLLIPEALFQFIFGEEFGEIKMVILTLAFGIFVFALSGIFSHYFSGMGNHHINTISALIGFVFTVIGCLILIPALGLIGAGIAASISYTASTIYQWIIFRRQTDVRLVELIPTKRDFQLFAGHLKKTVKVKS